LRHEEVEPESILGTCIAAIPEEEIARMVATALQNVEVEQYDEVISVVYESLDLMGLDPIPLMSEGLARSGIWQTLEDLNRNGIVDPLENSLERVTLTTREFGVEDPEAVEVVERQEVNRVVNEPVASES